MFLFTLYRILKFAIQGFWRNFWLSVVTISVIVLALVSINFLLILNVSANSAVEYVQDKIDISIYFKNDVDESIIIEAKNRIETLSQVEKIDYISKDRAIDDFRQKHKNDRFILEALEAAGENPLVGSLKIKSRNIDDYQMIMYFINSSKYDQYIYDKNFDDHKSFINQIHNISKIINTVGIIVVLIFVIISILIVFNTIRLTIYAHKDEIAVMKYVGASNFFITSPYFFEGILYSIISFVISIFIFYFLINSIQPITIKYFQGMIDIKAFISDNGLYIFGSEFIGTALLTVFASAIAIRRYLRV
ncbi:MAG: hypothetical protein US74_C0043G0007 [Parcubacteria group bacterium GW2011_GWA2_38_13]|nr:MAG: hypothetical protein US74_C0043G0007 [Parcubacteria group bacterium GW2011_GWA2_38_13]